MTEGEIRFEERQVDMGDLLREIGTPGMKKSFKLPAHVATELRRHQITRLEENIAILRKKQEEFHSKMEDYIKSLRRLIANLEKGLESAEPEPAPKETSSGTHVRCIGCGSEQVFDDIDVLFAREPEDMFAGPTEVIVRRGGGLRKGSFRCPRCGDCNLSIKPR